MQLDCAHGEKGIAGLKSAYQALLDADAGLDATNEWLDSEDEILKKMPLLSRDQIKGWKAVFSKDGGWLAAAKAINAIGEYLRNQGVKFGFYGAGSFKQPLLAEGTCIGVETIDGTKYYADKVILAAGAWSSALVDLEEQCVSKAGLHLTQCLYLRLNTDLSGLGVRPHSTHSTGSRSLQERTRRLQRRRGLLLRA
jgi:sarcosine oxidase/L-pipecolate oxidase